MDKPTESTAEMKWPAFFPPGCPPEDALEANGTFYRIVLHDPPAIGDFLSMIQKHPDSNYHDMTQSRRHSVSPIFRACGLSVHDDKNDAEANRSRLANRIPAKRDTMLAEGELCPEMGKVMHTPSRQAKSHHTWWMWEGVDPSDEFTVINDEAEC